MINQKKNLYKQTRVFRCVHDVHRHFKSELSPFYILNQKKCFPDGCVYFHWKCRLLAKQKKCFRGFSFVGSKCCNCRYFYEEKQHHYPEFINPEQDKNTFLETFEEFETWVAALQSRRVPCEGVVAAVLPDLSLREQGGRRFLEANGFLIRFDEGFIDNQLFEDPFYLSISSMTQNKLLFRKGDSVEFEANLNVNQGRFKFYKSGRFQFYERGAEKALRKSDILVAIKTYTIQENQPGKCSCCESGVLTDMTNTKPGPSREIVCLQGIADYRDCTLNMVTAGTNNRDTCINTDWDKKQCHHVL